MSESRAAPATAGRVPFATWIDPDLRQRVKVFAAERGTLITRVVAEALEAYLSSAEPADDRR